MNHRIIEKDSFRVIGKAITVTGSKKQEQIPDFWRECHNDGTIEALHSIGGDVIMGIGDNDSHDGCFGYMIGTISDAQPSDRWVSRVIPASIWVVFDPVVSTPALVGPVWEYIFQDFLPNGVYMLANTPDLEVNYRQHDSSGNYLCEIWIPVIKKP